MPKKQLSKQELYNIALKKHIKWMRSLGLNVDDNGYIIKSSYIIMMMVITLQQIYQIYNHNHNYQIT